MLYGVWQDAHMSVKFTDVDYHVFTDAAKFVVEGESVYKRATYRYTPLLAWVLTLNIWVTPFIGKLIFIAFDVLTGHTIYTLLRKMGHEHHIARNCSLFWLLNPLSATVSSRGNAESVMSYLVLMSLLLLVQGKTLWSAVFYGLAIHFKIYPITFSLPIYLYLNGDAADNKSQQRKFCFWKLLLPNRDRILFFSISGGILGILTTIFYYMYGWTFLFETYLYHVVRGDIKHNFSPYFYLLYLTSDPTLGVPLCLRLLVFLPQVILLVAVALTFHRDQPMAWFLCTFIFVMANKVCTSQYFLWYLSLLPIVLPSLHMNATQYLSLASLWFFGQAVWLCPAYYLEFEGYNTFMLIWLAGLLFFCINGMIVYNVIKNYKKNNFKHID
ncbi:GPI mannosyltransferase 1 [Biomphalaria glabrata]|nr:GPI mannosyltransferase 1 [Biomphalaria glabrata]